MLDLSKHVLPSAVEVGGSMYKIKTDFTYWVRFGTLLQDKAVTFGAFDYLYEREKPADRQAGFFALMDFFRPEEPLPKSGGEDEEGPRILDYVLDGSRIYAAFMQCYRIDLVDTPMHWHKFLALLSGITGTQLNKIIEFRSWEKPTGEKNAYENTMRELQEAWSLPPTARETEALDAFNARFD